MKGSLKVILITIVAVLLSGCCTTKTQSDINKAIETKNICGTLDVLEAPVVYSGTYYDTYKNILLPFTCHGEGCFLVLYYPVVLIGGLIDLPFDIVLDTLLLPHTIPLALSIKCKNKITDSVEINMETDEQLDRPLIGVPPRSATHMMRKQQ